MKGGVYRMLTLFRFLFPSAPRIRGGQFISPHVVFVLQDAPCRIADGLSHGAPEQRVRL